MGTKDFLCLKTWMAIAAAVLLILSTVAPLCSAQEVRDKKLPLVWVLATGGTIAGRGTSPTDLSNYKSGALTGEEIVRSVPQLEQLAHVKVEQIANVPSYDITLDNWLTLANRINEIFAKDSTVAGIVVTHGTNTLEETAYFLNLTIKHDRPVVLVGAMRPATAISADGPLNLLNAVRTAVVPEARGKGVLIVLNDEINGARDATKTDTHRLETFRAPELGFLGYVDDDKVSFYRSSTRRHTVNSEFDVSGIKQLPNVEIVYSYIQPSTTVLRALMDSGVQGIVFAGTGAGDINSLDKSVIRTALASPAASRPVLVRASRVGNGRVTGSDELDRLGMIPADNLNPQKARIPAHARAHENDGSQTDPADVCRVLTSRPSKPRTVFAPAGLGPSRLQRGWVRGLDAWPTHAAVAANTRGSLIVLVRVRWTLLPERDLRAPL